jgi:hypothetical protein
MSTLRRAARAVLPPSRPTDLLPLDLTTRRLRAFEGRHVGLRAIPLHQIVGSDSRIGDFDRNFLPRRKKLRERWQHVEQAFPQGAFPPIVVRQVGEAYFVVDGHHRVAIARQLGMETIDAEVTVLHARWQLRADADIMELTHAEQEWIFSNETGLGRVRPEARIRFSEPVGYVELLENVELHGYRLMREQDRILSRSEIAADWFDRIYLPATAAIRQASFEGVCPRATEADRFLWIEQFRRTLLLECGATTIEDAVQKATELPPRRKRRPRDPRLSS